MEGSLLGRAENDLQPHAGLGTLERAHVLPVFETGGRGEGSKQGDRLLDALSWC